MRKAAFPGRGGLLLVVALCLVAMMAVEAGSGQDPVDAFIPTDRETGRPRGFGFVTMPSSDSGRRLHDTVAVTATPIDKSDISQLGSADQFAEKLGYLFGRQASAGESVNEGRKLMQGEAGAGASATTETPISNAKPAIRKRRLRGAITWRERRTLKATPNEGQRGRRLAADAQPPAVKAAPKKEVGPKSGATVEGGHRRALRATRDEGARMLKKQAESRKWTWSARKLMQA